MYKRTYIVNECMRIDEFAYQNHISKKALKDIKMYGDILVNGEHKTVRYIVNPNDIVTFIYPPENNHIKPQNMPLKIVYEDDYLLILDKKYDIACIPTRGHPHSTLANALSYYYQHIGLSSTIHLVNRLDRETQGLMMVAKYREIHDMMSRDMPHILRKYRMHVKGVVQSSGLIDLPIYKQDLTMKRIIDSRGQQAKTHYKVIDTSENKSYIECQLETGRTHQIRVHFSHIGHPLIGDSLYGDGQGQFDLTSVFIAFIHPVTQQIKVIRKK